MSQRFVWLVAIVIVFGLIVWGAKVNDTSPTIGGSPSPSASATASPSTPVRSRARTPTPAVSTVSYSQALRDYAGRIMQLDAYCQATPNQVVIKNGAAVMFDNRSGDARWIALNGVGYQIAGYGFRIFPMTSKSLPETVIVDCGSAPNIGRIIIQQ